MKPSARFLLTVLTTAAASLLLAAPNADAKTADQCKGSFTQCSYRCRQMLIPTEESHCQAKCRLSENKCLDAAYKDTESGQTAPVASPPADTPANQPAASPARSCPPGYAVLDKPNKYGAFCEVISSPTGGAGSEPCDAAHVRYDNGTCGCPSGMTGANCDEIIVH
jgi:hypothetical protein